MSKPRKTGARRRKNPYREPVLRDIERWHGGKRSFANYVFEDGRHFTYWEDGECRADFLEKLPGSLEVMAQVMRDMSTLMEEIAFDAEVKAPPRDPYGEVIRAVVIGVYEQNPKGYQVRAALLLTELGITPPLRQRMSDIVRALKSQK